jgi:hypothetical protein
MIQMTWTSRDGRTSVIVEGSAAAVAAGIAQLEAAQQFPLPPTTNGVQITPLSAPRAQGASTVRVVRSGAFPDSSPPEPRPSYYGAASATTKRPRSGAGAGEPLRAPVLDFRRRDTAKPPTVETANKRTPKVTPLSVPKLEF